MKFKNRLSRIVDDIIAGLVIALLTAGGYAISREAYRLNTGVVVWIAISVIIVIAVVAAGIVIWRTRQRFIRCIINIMRRFLYVIFGPRSEIHHIRPIKSVLSKGESSSGQFFRLSGPTWLDFQEEFVVIRDEVSEVIESLKKNRCHLIVGDAASGKSVLAKAVGYLLSKQYRVYFLNAEEFSTHDVHSLFAEVKLLDSMESPTLLIVDDLHKNPRSSNDFLVDVLENTRNVKLLLVTRQSYGLSFERRDFNVISPLEDQAETHTRILARNVASNIVRAYHEKMNLVLPVGGARKLLELSENDLCKLSYLLKGLKDTQNIDLQQVYSNIRDDLFDLDRSVGLQASCVVLTVSAMYQYEIPVTESFLIEVLKFTPETIRCLAKRGDLAFAPGNRTYAFHHSSIARFYVETAKWDTTLLDGIPHLTLIKDFDKELLHLYIQHMPANYDALSTRLRYEVEIFREIFENPETKGAIIKILDRENNLFTAMSWISDITWASEANCLTVLEALNEEQLMKKIKEENNVAVIGYAIGNIPWPIIDVIGSEIDQIEEDRYKEAKLIYNLSEVDFCLWRIPFDLPENVKKMVDVDLNITRLRRMSTTIAEVKNILPCVRSIFAGKVSLCTKSLFCQCPKLGVRVVKKLDLDILTEKTNKESDLFKVAYCIANIDWADHKIANKLVSKLSTESLLAKLEAEDDPDKVVFLLWQISRISPTISRSVLDVLQKHFVDKDFLPSGWIS